MIKKERFRKVIDYFTTHMPVAETELTYENPFSLLVAVILSAQCTDRRVNMITPVLLSRYPDAASMAEANSGELFEMIKSCSYPNNKAKHLIAMSRTLIDKFDGAVPDNLEDLQKLPGVGRKTANVILSVAFHKPAMAVDTHVFRVSERIGLTTRAKNPYDAELQLLKYIPEEKLSLAHHWLILHGRYICTARNPKCSECGLRAFCTYYEKSLDK
ncbi:MAG: endonuclease III [Bacteroidales bacterium]|nr:endonuclease III [Bacteroidales bacterium]MBN2697279.1 endonuclease III [Bacteroidales bacterium]